MVLDDALETIANSLKKDHRVKAIFVKGSVGRGEHDEHSDLDLYCLVDEADLEDFLKSKIHHLESYGQLLFHDDIFIVAPQILAVYENMLHVDLFTVTEQTFIEKDFFKVIYDPDQRLEKYKTSQNLRLSSAEFQDCVDDTVWFLFQYMNSNARGNDLWSVNMLHNVMSHVSKILLHRYNPERAQLGLKTIETALPRELVDEIRQIYENITPVKHRKAVILIYDLLNCESDWLFSEIPVPAKIKPLWDVMITEKRLNRL